MKSSSISSTSGRALATCVSEMRVIRRWTVGKRLDEPLLNSDASRCSEQRGVYAVSDGASESFASGRWAHLLVSRYVRQPKIDAQTLGQAIAAYNETFDRQTMSWSAQASFDRGSFATLLGIQLDQHGVSILGIGDSLVVLDDGTSIRSTFPYSSPEEFRANPLLLSTLPDRNHEILQADSTTYWTLDDIEFPKLFCMTDAIGAWLLSQRDERMQRLRALETRAAFVDLVETARADGTMRRDDTTLLVIG